MSLDIIAPNEVSGHTRHKVPHTMEACGHSIVFQNAGKVQGD